MTSTLVINVSNYVSPYCYSLLRAEPYTSCDFRCWYCYSRWYWRTLSVNVNNFAIALVKKFIRSVIRKGLKPIPLRLSTLSDPFHSLEVKAKASLAVLKECLKHEYLRERIKSLLRNEKLNLGTISDILANSIMLHLILKFIEERDS